MNFLPLKNLGLRILEFFFPCFCVGCGKVGGYCCLKCEKSIMLKYHFVGFEDEPEISSLDGLVVMAKYEGVLKKLIHAFKYQFIKSIGGKLSLLMAKNLNISGESMLTFVPLHSEKEKYRGFNQAKVLAEGVSEITGIECRSVLLRLEKAATQSLLERKERLKNVEGIYALDGEWDLNRRDIILVDDVATTGATLNACAKVLKQVGARQVIGLVLARSD